MRALGYVRVSTENQIGPDSFGLETQRDAIMKYCESNGQELIEIYEDPALSGSLPALERPGLQAVLEAVQDGDKVVVPRLDRIARDLYLSLWVEKEIRKAGAELISVSEPYRWNDPTQKLLLNIIMSFAEFERSLITSRLSSGRKTKARAGGYAGGKAPIGYRAERGDKALILDEEKAGTVKRAFELQEASPDASLRKIADALNAEGHTSKEGKPFHPMQVKRIFDRKAFYEGIYRYSGVIAEGQHEAIL
ncbi:MAG: recombinase family protein [Methanothrix soehngenii]|jgi:DNA invertase Pin-like site-specific DNA recombinase|nr:recombinase family protein [Methanothrix soehngenii]